MPIEFDGPNSKVSADTIAGQGGSTITIQSGHSLSGSGASLTALNATELTSGTLPMARLSGTLPALNGSALTALPAANLTGTIAAISGANLTSLNASNLGSGTVPTARLGSGTASSSTFLRGDSTYAVAGGGMVKLGAVTASADSTVDFDSLFSSTYDTYCVTCTNMVMSGDGNNIIIRVKIAGSAKTDANYKQASNNIHSNGTNTVHTSNGTASIRMDFGVGTSTGESGNFIFYIYDPLGTNNHKCFAWHSTENDSTGVYCSNDGGGTYVGATTALTGIQFLSNSGTITRGKFILYGMVK